MAGVQAGRLNIEIVAEIARLQQDLDKAKRAVKSMSNDIARDTKAANDNFNRMGTTFQQTSNRMVASAGQQRAGFQQLSMQIGDMATQYALGARPMQIFAAQAGQTLQAIQLMSGGTSRFAAFMGGPWGALITAGTLVLVPLISKLFEAEGAVKQVEFASYKLGDAQSILGSVMDMTTGKINTQKDALLALARAQLVAGQIKARADMATARSDMTSIRRGSVQLTGGMGGGFGLTRSGNADVGGILEAFGEGSLNTREAVAGLESLRKTGRATEKEFLDAAKAVTDFGVAAENLKVFKDAEKGLLGNKSALAQFLDPAKASKGPRERKARSGPTVEEIEARFAKELSSWTQRNLRAQMDLAMSVEERVEYEQRAIEWDRKGAIADIAADKDYSAEQKERLRLMIEANNEFRLEILERERVRELAKEAADIAQAQHDNAVSALQAQLGLADTEAQRKSLALQIFDTEQAFLRERLQAVITANTINGIQNQQAKLAQMQLDGLNANGAAQRAGVGRQNETTRDRWIRDLNMTRDQMNEALDQVAMNGLDALNAGLVDAMVNFRSLGDVAQSVVRQILAGLMQIAIQQMIIKPLAGALGLSVGTNAYGTNYWRGGRTWVGEDGPEMVDLPQGARVIPSHQSANDNRGGGAPVHFHFPSVTNAREAREAGSQAAREYRRKLNNA